MNFLPLIEAKREGQSLTADQIGKIVEAFTHGRIPDYQMAAFLMAIFFQGLSEAETTALTLAMRDSGHVLKFPKDKRLLVDKHSTGGVGDKVSLPLAPLLACLRFRVPMISGRGLGITGGTLDKLDSIPGFKTLLPTKRIIQIVQQVGCVICGQTDRMVPADKKLYALRDATGAVPSIPLITASILSKKLAEGLDALLLDVKFGRAAFMQSRGQASKLAKEMVQLGNQCGVNTRAVLSDMNTPLGRAAGNWLEVKESVACLDGTGPEDLHDLVVTCAALLLVQTKRADSVEAGRKLATRCLASGAPRQKWDEMLLAQGANLKQFNRKLMLDRTAPVVVEMRTKRSGFISRCDARLIGEVVRDLGGGRLTKESVIDYDAGVDQIAGLGDRVSLGGVLCRIHSSDWSRAEVARKRIVEAFAVTARPVKSGRSVTRAISAA